MPACTPEQIALILSRHFHDRTLNFRLLWFSSRNRYTQVTWMKKPSSPWCDYRQQTPNISFGTCFLNSPEHWWCSNTADLPPAAPQCLQSPVPAWWSASGTRAGWPCACAAARTWTSSSRCHWRCQTQQPEAAERRQERKSWFDPHILQLPEAVLLQRGSIQPKEAMRGIACRRHLLHWLRQVESVRACCP